MELILFFKFSFLVSLILAPSLNMIGHHLLLRGKTLEIFALAQFAIVGNLSAHIIFHHDNSIMPLILSCIFFAIGKVIISNLKLEKSIYGPFMIGLYLVLLSLQHMIVGLFPQVDSHMSASLFGDMVTATNGENIFLIVSFLLLWCLYFYDKKAIHRRSLEQSFFQVNKESVFDIVFDISLSTTLSNFLFTSFLFSPGMILVILASSPNS